MTVGVGLRVKWTSLNTGEDGGVAGGVLVGQRHQRIHVVDGEESGVPVQHPLEPVVVDLVGQGDDVTLLEAQLAVVLGVEVVEGAAAGLIHRS